MIQHHRWLGWLLQTLVTTFIIIWILTYLDLNELRQAAVTPAWLPLIGMAFAAWVFVLIGGAKFWVLFRALTPVPFLSFIGYFLVATALGTFTPATLGDFSLAAFLRREQIPVHQSMSVIVVDRVITIGIYGTVFLPLTFGLLLHMGQLWWAPVSFLVGGMLILILNRLPTVRKMINRFLKHLHLSFLSDFLSTTSDLLRLHPWHLLGNVGLTLLRCVVSGGVVQFALWAAGEWQPFLPVLYTTNSISLINLLPVSLAGLGVYEGGGVAILSQLGFDQERVFAGLMYQRFYIILYSLVMLILSRLLIERMRRWAQITEEVEQ